MNFIFIDFAPQTRAYLAYIERRINRFGMTSLMIGILLFFVMTSKVFAQSSAVNISIFVDDDRGSRELNEIVKQEIDLLISSDHEVRFTEYPVSDLSSFRKNLVEAYGPSTDIVISSGVKSSLFLSLTESYEKPTIAGLLLDDSKSKVSGKDNYTFVRSPFSVQDDLEKFQEIVDFNHLAVFVSADLSGILENFLVQRADSAGVNIQIVASSDDVSEDVSKLEASVDAVYLLPFVYEREDQDKQLIQALNEKRLPTFALIGREAVENGVMAGLANSNFSDNYARRMAVNVLKVIDGENLGNFPVDMTTLDDDFAINVQTAQEVGVYPTFDMLSEATLIGVDYIPADAPAFTLEGAVLMAMDNNLELDIAEKDVELQNIAIKSAQAGLLPELSASATSTLVDNNTANSTFNAINGELSVTGNLALSQVVFAEPLLANVTIQKMLQKVESEALRQANLDVAQNTATAYLVYLLSRANARVQQENVEVTKQNLGLAKNRERIGTSSAADKYRFEAQLAQNSVDLNDAQTAEEQAKFNLNLLLNRPKEANLAAADIRVENAPLFLADPRIVQFVTNSYEIRKFGDFLADYAMKNLPELRQIEYSLEAQKRSLKSAKRSIYLPQVALVGNVNQTLGRYMDQVNENIVEMQTGIDPFDPTWNLSLNATLPIFQGFSRKASIQNNRVSVLQLEDQKDLLMQANETNVRNQLENVSNSYGDVTLNRKSAEAAGSYLTIVQELYQEGAVDIATLLDAQNNALFSEIGLINAQYQLLIDGFALENAIGFMYLLSTPQEREAFIEAFRAYMIEQQ